jgi:hypothetical protein
MACSLLSEVPLPVGSIPVSFDGTWPEKKVSIGSPDTNLEFDSSPPNAQAKLRALKKFDR